jgi:hypothetical protein
MLPHSPHIQTVVDFRRRVRVQVSDPELFDFVDNFLKCDCDYDYDEVIELMVRGRHAYQIVLPRDVSLAEVEAALARLDPLDIETIVRLNTPQVVTLRAAVRALRFEA